MFKENYTPAAPQPSFDTNSASKENIRHTFSPTTVSTITERSLTPQTTTPRILPGPVSTSPSNNSHRILQAQRHSISHLDRATLSQLKTTAKPILRRNSFLSESMLSNESHIVYKLSSYGYGMGGGYGFGGREGRIPVFMLALKESQGFAWNQDLFVSRYLQETGVIYDSDDYPNTDYAIKYDEDEDHDEDMGDYVFGQRRRRQSSAAYSYSGSHEEGASREKVRVIPITLTEEEMENDTLCN